MTISYALQLGNNPLDLQGYILLGTLFVVISLMFFRLKIVVDDECIHVIYGIGLIHIRIRPEKIKKVEIIKTSWYNGLGIRFTNKGMLYNIQGSSAVRIYYFEGEEKIVSIGSADAMGLKDFIEKKYNINKSDILSE